jgi:hypothetical protein
VFTIPILAFTMSDLGVHVAPIPVFTFDRSGRSRSTGTRTPGTSHVDRRHYQASRLRK